MTSEFLQVASVSVPETTYLVVPLKNGAPGSSSAVRVDHAGSNISYVVRPSRMPWLRSVNAPMASPIFGSKPYSNVHVGASTTPSRLMNSCTCIAPISSPPCRCLRSRPRRRRKLIARLAGRRADAPRAVVVLLGQPGAGVRLAQVHQRLREVRREEQERQQLAVDRAVPGSREAAEDVEVAVADEAAHTGVALAPDPVGDLTDAMALARRHEDVRHRLALVPRRVLLGELAHVLLERVHQQRLEQLRRALEDVRLLLRGELAVGWARHRIEA